MKRKHKNYSRPKKAFEKERIKDENKIKEQYGLKNKKEIWKTIAKVNYLRRRAKALAKATTEEQEAFFKKLQNLGLKVTSTADVLALEVKDLLERRLQTLVMKKKIANTARHARQMITHKKILVGDTVNNTPSTLITLEKEKQITAKPKKVKKAPVEEPKAEEAPAAPAEQAEAPAEQPTEEKKEETA